MPRFCVGFKDADGADLAYSLLQKEFVIESFPQLLNQNKIPTLWVWGINCAATLGDNTTTSKSSPVQTISGGSNWKLTHRNSFGNMNTAIKDDGTLWNWGEIAQNLIGDIGGVNRSSPVQTLVGGCNWKCVSAGFCSIVALKTDGSLWVWGQGNFGHTGQITSRYGSGFPIETGVAGKSWRAAVTGSGGGVLAIRDGCW